MQDLRSFFFSLSEQAKDLVPIAYRTMSISDFGKMPVVRYAESTRYRSEGYACFGFHKPISRIFKPQPSEVRPTVMRSPARVVEDRPPLGDDSIFLLFACCVPVMGARRSSLCDLQRGVVQLIPNGLAEILKKHRGKTVAEIKKEYKNKYDSQINEYLCFLIANEFGFLCDDIENFPDLDLSWNEPERITNALIDVDISSEHNFKAILNDLDDLGCKALQVRYYSGGHLAQLREVLSAARRHLHTCNTISGPLPFRGHSASISTALPRLPAD